MRKFVVLAAALSLSAGSAALAHHSGAMFDRQKIVEVRGVLIAMEYANPHVWIRVKQTGARQSEFDVEANGVTSLQALGLTPVTLKPGDKIVLHTHPLRDGRAGGDLVDITLANGRFLSVQSANTERVNRLRRGEK